MGGLVQDQRAVDDSVAIVAQGPGKAHIGGGVEEHIVPSGAEHVQGADHAAQHAVLIADFTSILNRKNMDAIAVDALGHGTAPGAPKEGFDPIPMWVADMNFPTVPTVQEARKRVRSIEYRRYKLLRLAALD